MNKYLSFYFMFSFCSVSFTILTKSVDRWTNNENSGKKVLISFFLAWKCGHVDKKLTFYFISSFFLALFDFSAKSADRWTSNENSEKKFQPYMLYCLKVWTCGQESVFLFYVLFLLCTLHKHDKKCGQVDK